MVSNVPKLSQIHMKNCRLFEDRRQMLSLVSRNGVGAELGVFRGDFSEVLLEALSPKRLVLIDRAFNLNPKERFGAAIQAGQVEVITGDSSSELSKYPDELFDWIYIDGDHSYEGVTKDAAVAKSKVRSSGCLMFNDYKMGDHNHPEGFYPYGVIHAVNELCIQDGWEMVGFAFHFQMYCDVALRRRV